MFQFTHGLPPCLYIQHGVSRHHSGRVAPFGYSGLIARMQLPLNVSPVSASFIGLQRLGIHLVLCLACGSTHLFPEVCVGYVSSVILCVYGFDLRSGLPSSHSRGQNGAMTPLAFLCFSLLALGKIEVIVILICNAVVNVQVRRP